MFIDHYTDMAKVLVTGASGLLGRAIMKEFKQDNTWETTGLALKRSGGPFDLDKVDITDPAQVKEIFNKVQPAVVIHSAAERRPDVVEKQEDATRRINVEATKFLCQEAARVGAVVVFISTDYVFDGTQPPHKESYQPNPLNKYGMSKLEGEQVTMQVSKENMILRVPIMYGDVEYLDESSVSNMLPKLLDNKTTCKMSSYERRYPTYCPDVSAVLSQLLKLRIKDSSLTGIFHWSGDENMTRYDMCVGIAETLGLSVAHIEANNTPSAGAKRPYDAHLDTGRIEKLGICTKTSFHDGVAASLKKYVNG